MFMFAKGHNVDVLNTLERLSLARYASLKERVAIAATLNELFPTEAICNQLLQLYKAPENTSVSHNGRRVPEDTSVLSIGGLTSRFLPSCRRARMQLT